MNKNTGVEKKWFRLIGAVIIFIGIVLFAFQLGEFLGKDKKGIIFNAPGAIEVRVEKPDEYQVFYKYNDDIDDENKGLNIIVYEKGSKKQMQVSEVIDEAVYDIKLKPWNSIFEFYVDKPTTFIIEANYEGGNGPSLMIKASADFMSKSLPAIIKMATTLFVIILSGSAIFFIPNIEKRRINNKSKNNIDSKKK